MKKTFSGFLAALLAALLCACGNGAPTAESGGTDTDPASLTAPQTPAPQTGEPAETDEHTRTDEQTDAPDTHAAPAVTAAPVIKGCAVIGRGSAMVYGTCEADCAVTVSCSGKSFTARSDGVYFAVPVTYERTVSVSVCAQAEGKEKSGEVSVLVKYDKTAEDKGVAVTLGSRVIEKKVLPDLYGTNGFDPSETEAIKKAALYRLKQTEKTAGKPVRLVYIIVPNPMTVYPEEMTDGMKAETVERSVRLKQAVKALGEVDGVTVIDLTDALTAEKDKGKLYYKLDSHWTELGAYYGYAEVMRTLGMPYHPLDDFTVEYVDIDDTDMNVYSGVGTGEMYESAPFLTANFELRTPYGKNKAKTARIWDFGNEFFIGKTSESSAGTGMPSALFLFDSYGFNIIPFLAEHWSTFVTQPVWKYSVDYSAVKRIKPDYVIELIAERDLGELLSAT